MADKTANPDSKTCQTCVSQIVDLYASGKSMSQVSLLVGMPISSVRRRLKKAGVLRSKAEGIRLAASDGRLGSGMRGKSRVFTDDHKKNISNGMSKWGRENAVGFSLKPSGYIEHTRGVHKGRSVHVVIMERRLGRKLLPDECVHHIDRDTTNNAENNLALMTRSAHSRLHRFEDNLEGIKRERKKNGQFS